tara:strand:+ start:395 stop:769 length:375 start_codon:yes stop_codon:yes gene_type:complete
MRTKIAIGILIIFCFAEIRPLLPYVDYFVNYEYISKVLCINKDEPIPTCNGKCYLSQQLKEAQETEKKDKGIPTVEQERIPMIFYDYDFPKVVVVNSTSNKISNFYQFAIKELVNSQPTPPPKC